MRDFQKPGRSAVLATDGLCATSHPLAAQVAIRILQDGGNAADAAIAGAVLLGICEPMSTGIGGDAFVLVKPAGSDELVGLNGSGRSPAGLDADALCAAGQTAIAPDSVEAVTIPGAIDLFARLAEDWGALGLAACLAPAIHYADEGVPVAGRTASAWAEDAPRLQGAARRHYLSDGRALQVGDRFRAPGQAEILRKVAREGRAGFYEGEVAEDMVSSLRALGGTHTLDDFHTVACTPVTPITGGFRGHDLAELPPNGQGATAILMAQILDLFDLSGLDPEGAQRVHLETEAARLAYDARDRFIADPEPGPLRTDHMIAPDTASDLAALIDPKRARPDLAKAAAPLHGDTVYLSVVDRDRMAVSMIYSIYHGFGSGLASERYGVNFQNRGAGFSLVPGHPNAATGGKRPLHTIIPAMLRRGTDTVLSFGVMGGDYQPAGHVRVLANMLDYGMDPQAALDGPRSFPSGGTLALETGYDGRVAAALQAIGHEIAWRKTPLGGGQAVLIDAKRGVLIGGSDPRKDGAAIGY